MSKTAQCLSREEIRDAADHVVDNITGVELACRNIPQSFPEELETDEATVELRHAKLTLHFSPSPHVAFTLTLPTLLQKLPELERGGVGARKDLSAEVSLSNVSGEAASHIQL